LPWGRAGSGLALLAVPWELRALTGKRPLKLKRMRFDLKQTYEKKLQK
jgi:hypothetical protein